MVVAFHTLQEDRLGLTLMADKDLYLKLISWEMHWSETASYSQTVCCNETWLTFMRLGAVFPEWERKSYANFQFFDPLASFSLDILKNTFTKYFQKSLRLTTDFLIELKLLRNPWINTFFMMIDIG